MKKIIIVLLAAALIVFGSSAFAQELRTPEQRQHSRLTNKAQVVDFAEKVLQKKQVISQNREQLAILKRQLNSSIKETKAHIKKLQENGSSIDADSLNTIRAAFNEINSSKNNLAATEGLLQRKGAALREARLQKKPEVFIQTLDEIIVMQQKRIALLKKMLTDLDRLDSALG